MHSISLVLALLVGCGGGADPAADGPVVDGADPGEKAAGPPEGFACPEGTEQKSGGLDEVADLWFQPTLPRLMGADPMKPPEEGFEEVAVVPEMDAESALYTCVKEDGSRHGPYFATVAGGTGRITGLFTEGKAEGEWLGLWLVEAEEGGAGGDAPAEDAPAEEPPAEEPPAEEAPAEGAPEGAEPADGGEPAPAPKPKPWETEEGTRLMFRGAFAGGERSGAWFQGCEPGCEVNFRVQALFDEEAKMHGKWQWVGDGETATLFLSHGAISGRFTHVHGEVTEVGSYANGERKGRWVKKKDGEVIEETNHGGTVRRLPGKKRGGGGTR